MLPKMEKGISVVLLAYKEEENLRVLLPEIKQEIEKTGEKYEILVIDTQNPTDNTKDVCAENGARYINQEEPAFGGAFRTGIKYADMNKFLILDSDGSHNPVYITDIYNKFMEGYDLVIGSRYVEGGKTDDSKTSILMSKILNTTFRIALGIKAKDISTDYRMYDTVQLKKVTTKASNYDVLQEVILRLKLNNPGFKIGETPISFDKRMFGESKRNLIAFIVSYVKTLYGLVLLRAAKTDEKQKSLNNILLYGLFGILAAVIDYGVFTVLKLSVFSADAEAANITGQICGFIFAFFTNTFWNFKKSNHIALRFLSYALICTAGIVFTTFMINQFKEKMNVFLLKLLLLIFVSAAQFILNKFITYRSRIK